ncbi:hypothetical protein [Natrinema sp. 1APR25-10V2]|nr:hypothetical protein [Natrinema sp. 1APR25-10V2]MDS0475358.1 hypothetical protein [Natrinema sp. 1APR25-10V2]
MALVDSQPPVRRRLERHRVDERTALATPTDAPETKGRETAAVSGGER